MCHLEKTKKPRKIQGSHARMIFSKCLNHPVAIEPRPLSRLSDRPKRKLDESLITVNVLIG
jgi:hypothetical protein